MEIDAVLVARERRYPKLAEKVKRLLEVAQYTFNPTHFPSTSFEQDVPNRVRVRTLGYALSWEFQFLVDASERPFLVLDVCLPTDGGQKEVVARWFIDANGNVRKEPTDQMVSSTIEAPEFVRELVHGAQQAIFKRVLARGVI